MSYEEIAPDKTKEEIKKIILSLEGLKQREWEDIRRHIDRQFERQFYEATNEQQLILDKPWLDNCLETMDTFLKAELRERIRQRKRAERESADK